MEESFSRGSIPACICSPLSLSHPYYEANYLLSTPRAANSQDAGKKTKTATGRWLRHMDGCGSGASTVCLSGSKINIPAVYLEHYRWSLIINVERSRFFRNDVRGKGPAMSEPEFRPCIGGPDWIITCKQAKKSSLFCCLCCWHTHTHTHTGCEWEHWAEPLWALPELTGEQQDWDCWALSCNYCSIFLMKSLLFSRGTDSSSSKGHTLSKDTCDWMNNPSLTTDQGNLKASS